jgi:hypothetical protein
MAVYRCLQPQRRFRIRPPSLTAVRQHGSSVGGRPSQPLVRRCSGRSAAHEPEMHRETEPEKADNPPQGLAGTR